MMKLAVSVVDLDASAKGFAELDFGTGEAEALWLGRDLETAAVPLHDVVIADDALVDKATDAAEIFRGRAPGLFGFSRSAAEATIVSLWCLEAAASGGFVRDRGGASGPRRTTCLPGMTLLTRFHPKQLSRFNWRRLTTQTL
jgi:hypothetical protein